MTGPRPSAQATLVAAIFAAIALKNLDKQTLALLKPFLDAEFGWSDGDYGIIVAASQFAAAVCLPLMGWLADVVSIRRFLPIGVGFWSALTIAQAFVASAAAMLCVRVALNAAESIGTPAAVKAIATAIPSARRQIAMGAVNAAPNVGAILGPALVPALAVTFGWRAAAVVVGTLGLVWIVWWLRSAKPQLLPSAAPARTRLATSPSIWLLIASKALSDQLWWVFLFWIPDFFHRQSAGVTAYWAGAVAFLYVCAGLGSLFGGMASARVFASGSARARAIIAATSAVVALALASAPHVPAVLSLSACAVATFGHQVFAVLIFSTICGDAYKPKNGRLVGVAAFAGNLLATLTLALVGAALDGGLGYRPVFLGLALAYICAGACLHAALQLRSVPASAAT